MKVLNLVLAASVASFAAAPAAFALPDAVCGNGRHVGNPHCNTPDGGGGAGGPGGQDRDANIIATFEASHYCNIDGNDVTIATAFQNEQLASGTDNSLQISQNGPTTWSLDSVTSNGSNAAGSGSGFAVTNGDLNLDARLGQGATQLVNGTFQSNSVNIAADITPAAGVFEAGSYQIETTLRCVAGE